MEQFHVEGVGLQILASSIPRPPSSLPYFALPTFPTFLSPSFQPSLPNIPSSPYFSSRPSIPPLPSSLSHSFPPSLLLSSIPTIDLPSPSHSHPSIPHPSLSSQVFIPHQSPSPLPPPPSPRAAPSVPTATNNNSDIDRKVCNRPSFSGRQFGVWGWRCGAWIIPNGESGEGNGGVCVCSAKCSPNLRLIGVRYDALGDGDRDVAVTFGPADLDPLSAKSDQIRVL